MMNDEAQETSPIAVGASSGSSSFLIHRSSFPYPRRLGYDFADPVSPLAAHSERIFMPGRALLIAVLVAFAAFFSASCSRSSAGKTIGTASAARALPVQALAGAPKPVRRNIESVGSLFAYEEVT